MKANPNKTKKRLVLSFETVRMLRTRELAKVGGGLNGKTSQGPQPGNDGVRGYDCDPSSTQ
jgi:hypothetical protein